MRCRLRRRCGRLFRSHVTDKAKALARNGAQETLILASVLYCLAHGIDATGQRRLRDDTAIPHFVEQLILADDAIAILDEIQHQVEDLRLERNAFAGAAKLSPSDIKHMIFKEKSHLSNLTQLPASGENQACPKAKSSSPQSLWVRVAPS